MSAQLWRGRLLMLITTGKEFSSGFITATSKEYCSTCQVLANQSLTDTIPGLGISAHVLIFKMHERMCWKTHWHFMIKAYYTTTLSCDPWATRASNSTNTLLSIQALVRWSTDTGSKRCRRHFRRQRRGVSAGCTKRRPFSAQHPEPAWSSQYLYFRSK